MLILILFYQLLPTHGVRKCYYIEFEDDSSFLRNTALKKCQVFFVNHSVKFATRTPLVLSGLPYCPIPLDTVNRGYFATHGVTLPPYWKHDLCALKAKYTHINTRMPIRNWNPCVICLYFVLKVYKSCFQ